MMDIQPYINKLMINPKNGVVYYISHTRTLYNGTIFVYGINIKAAQVYPHSTNFFNFDTEWTIDRFQHLIPLTPTTKTLYGPPGLQNVNLKDLQRELVSGARRRHLHSQSASWWVDEEMISDWDILE